METGLRGSGGGAGDEIPGSGHKVGGGGGHAVDLPCLLRWDDQGVQIQRGRPRTNVREGGEAPHTLRAAGDGGGEHGADCHHWGAPHCLGQEGGG